MWAVHACVDATNSGSVPASPFRRIVTPQTAGDAQKELLQREVDVLQR